MRKHKGFTLIELVVVVMILGILAAVAAPRLLSTSSTASDTALRQTLGVVRDAIERYAAEHGGALPGADGLEATFKGDLAPYIRGPFPTCPVAGNNNSVKMSNEPGDIEGEATPQPNESWHYNATTGQFICNSNVETSSDPTIRYDQL